jgi:hypothetical protein
VTFRKNKATILPSVFSGVTTLRLTGRRQLSPFSGLKSHGVITHKTHIDDFTAVKTSVLITVLVVGVKSSLTLREEQSLRLSDNMALSSGQISTKRDEVTGWWTGLRNGKLRSLYSSPNVITAITSRDTGWTEHAARIGEMRNV